MLFSDLNKGNHGMRHFALVVAALLALTLALTAQHNATGTVTSGGVTVSSAAGERIPLGVTETGGWSAPMVWSGGDYVVGYHNGELIGARIDLSGSSPSLLYVATIVEPSLDGGGGETHLETTWTCQRGLTHTVTTKITTKYADSDLKKHDAKLNKALLRHPPARPNKVEETPANPKNAGGPAPDPLTGGTQGDGGDILNGFAPGGDGGLVNLPGGGAARERAVDAGGDGGLVNLPGGGGAKDPGGRIKRKRRTLQETLEWAEKIKEHIDHTGRYRRPGDTVPPRKAG